MLITTNVASSNPSHDEVYSIQHYLIKFVSDLRQVGGFRWVSSTNKTDLHGAFEILLKVALSTIIHPPSTLSVVWLYTSWIRSINWHILIHIRENIILDFKSVINMNLMSFVHSIYIWQLFLTIISRYLKQ